MISTDEIKTNFDSVKKRVEEAALKAGRTTDDVKIVAVSKTHDALTIKSAKEAGITIFGENYAQELKEKSDYLTRTRTPQPEWHFIGHLQSNKVKHIAPVVSMIQCVDSLDIAEEISLQMQKLNRKVDILLQINTSGEATKSGCKPEETYNLLKEVMKLQRINFKGLMSIGSFSEDEKIYRKEFRLLKEIKDKLLKVTSFDYNLELSMGMTHDFEAAIEEGSTIVRIGTAIFGERSYS